MTVPRGAGNNAAYAIVFDHASGSPNGIASFKRNVRTGLITLSNRSGSSYNDGISDAWRLRYFGSVSSVLAQATADADGDGVSNYQEYLAGTDPTDPKSLLKMAGASAAANGPRAITWPSVTGKTYIIERSSSMFGGSWTPVSTNAGTGGPMEFDDASTGTVQFYRVRVQ